MSNGRELATCVHGTMSITIAEFNEQILVKWGGVFDVFNPHPILNEFFAKQEPLLRGKAVLLDFSQTEFINSATLSVILQLVKLLDTSVAKLTIKYDTRESWQMVSFRCMKAISRTLKNTEIVAVGSSGSAQPV